MLYEDFDRDFKGRTHTHTQDIKSLTHAKEACNHAYTQTCRQAGLAECRQAV